MLADTDSKVKCYTMPKRPMNRATTITQRVSVGGNSDSRPSRFGDRSYQKVWKFALESKDARRGAAHDHSQVFRAEKSAILLNPIP